MRNISCVLAAAACIGGSCYVGPPRLRSGAAGLEFESRTASGFERLQATEHEDSSGRAASSWNPLALGLALGLLAVVLGGPRTAVAVEAPPKDSAATLAQMLKRFDKKMDRLSRDIGNLTDEVQGVEANIIVDPIEKEMRDAAIAYLNLNGMTVPQSALVDPLEQKMKETRQLVEIFKNRARLAGLAEEEMQDAALGYLNLNMPFSVIG